MMDVSRTTSIDGDQLRGMLTSGGAALAENVEAVNALNVFPVPDGDTGTNMLLTLRAVGENAGAVDGSAIGAVGDAAAYGALRGARGSSGVILSQFLGSVCRVLSGHESADAALLARAFREGSDAAYRAVGKPVEGTILTVMRAAAEAMEGARAGGETDIVALFERALQGCQGAVERTPELLPVLKHAGVVDAGGQGFALLIQGAVRFLRGESVADIHLPISDVLGRVRESFLVAAESEAFGYCTQFLIEGQGLDPDAVRERASALAESAVVIGDAGLVRVHVHTGEPEALVAFGRSVGAVSEVKIESIDEQHQEFQAAHRRARPLAPTGMVIVALGEGLEAVFQDLGAGVVVRGGQTLNPSCQDLLDAIEALPAQAALLLPNNPNIEPVARQAASLAAKPVGVVPTRTVPEGIAAALAYSRERSLEGNVEEMTRAAGDVRSGEVVRAVRDARVDGTDVREGQWMGLLDGTLAALSDAPTETLAALVQEGAPEAGGIVTLYWGGGVTAEVADAAAAALWSAYPAVEVETLYGGQPHYGFIVSIE